MLSQSSSFFIIFAFYNIYVTVVDTIGLKIK